MNNNDHLTILWTSDNIITAEKMVFMYGLNAQKLGWWKQVTIVIWGAATELTANTPKVQEKIKELLSEGVLLSACKACADQLGHTHILEKLGVEVKYWGEPLTDILKKNGKLLTV